MSKRKDEMKKVLEEIKGYYKGWLSASGMTEENFFEYRTCEHFKVKILEHFSGFGLDNGFAVCFCHGKQEKVIGVPFFVGENNTRDEKMQYFENTPLLLIYLAGRLDKENLEKPISGSYGPDYFKDRVKKILPNIVSAGESFIEKG